MLQNSLNQVVSNIREYEVKSGFLDIVKSERVQLWEELYYGIGVTVSKQFEEETKNELKPKPKPKPKHKNRHCCCKPDSVSA